MAKAGYIRVGLQARHCRLIGFAVAELFDKDAPFPVLHFARELGRQCLRSGVSARGRFRPTQIIEIEVKRLSALVVGQWLMKVAVRLAERGNLSAEEAEFLLDMLTAGAKLSTPASSTKRGRPRVSIKTTKASDDRQIRRLKKRPIPRSLSVLTG